MAVEQRTGYGSGIKVPLPYERKALESMVA